MRFPSDPGRAVHLMDGRVTHVVSPGVPGIAERVLRSGGEPAETRDERARAAIREGRLTGLEFGVLVADAVADAAVDVLGPAATDATRSMTRFTPGPRHWAPLEPGLPVADLLAEIARRRRVLAVIAGRARPDDPLSRAAHLPVDRIRLTARQWDLARMADGRGTPRSIAHRLGLGVFATTVEAAALVRAGILAAPAGARAPAADLPFLRAVSGA